MVLKAGVLVALSSSTMISAFLGPAIWQNGQLTETALHSLQAICLSISVSQEWEGAHLLQSQWRPLLWLPGQLTSPQSSLGPHSPFPFCFSFFIPFGCCFEASSYFLMQASF